MLTPLTSGVKSYFVRLPGAWALGRNKTRALPGIEALEDRRTPAVAAFFNAGLLTVVGDANANVINVSADTNGIIHVASQGREVTVQGGTSTLTNTTLVSVSGDRGGDDITIQATLGTIRTFLDGGDGSDTLRPLNRGSTFEIGGAGNDSLISGFGVDTMLGGDGDDLLRWDPGTINDLMEGGNGNDTVQVIGNDTFQGQVAADQFQVTANGSRVRFDRLNLVPFTLDIGTTERLLLQPGAGDDVVTIKDLSGVANLRSVEVQGADGNDTLDGSQQANASIRLVLDGGAGDDVLRGGAGNDYLSGGAGNDRLYGNNGRDTLNGGAADDFLDAGRDGKADVAIGGDGADTFDHYFRLVKVDGVTLQRFNELISDFNADDGNVFAEIQL